MDYLFRKRTRLGFECQGESMTDQSAKNLSDVNQILKRYEAGVPLPPVKNPGTFADVTMLQSDLTTLINQSNEVLDKATNGLKELKNVQAQILKQARSQSQSSGTKEPESSVQPETVAPPK